MRDSTEISNNRGPVDNTSTGPLVIVYAAARVNTSDADWLIDQACKLLPDPTQFSNPHQTRPGRSKNKVPYWRRVEKRRRRTKLAKLHKKQIKEALARKAKLKAEADRAGTNPARKSSH